MITKLYPGYFQKSKVFLYPLLKLSKIEEYQPTGVYLTWEGNISIEMPKIILKYDTAEYRVNKEKAFQWDRFFREVLANNPYFDSSYRSEDGNTLIVVMDMKEFSSDYFSVVDGKYSEISQLGKALIQKYYGYNTLEWKYMETFLLPKYHFLKYAELLNVNVECLQEVGQLCSKPDFKEENLMITYPEYMYTKQEGI